MPTTTTRILGMSTVLKTREVGLYLVYVTVFRPYAQMNFTAFEEQILRNLGARLATTYDQNRTFWQGRGTPVLTGIKLQR